MIQAGVGKSSASNTKGANPLLSWCIGALVVVGLGIGACFLIASGKGSGTEKEPKQQHLKENKQPPPARPKQSQNAATNIAAQANIAAPLLPPPPPKRTNDVGRIVTNAFGRAFRIDAVVVPRGPRMNGAEVIRDRRLFVSNAENLLDGIVNQQLGDRFLGDFDEKQFEKEFLEAINNKIEITAEDDDDEARRKLEMIDMKKELLAAYKKGESIGGIVKAARDEVNKTADLRDDLISELVAIKKSAASPEEIESYYEAANEILAQRGVRPLYSPATIQKKLQEAKLRKLQNKKP